ncbi:MAG: tetratricopeptide repeat protein [Gammaproteobacteria bacterium]|nr:tetratricopeptide repeat protein [Gammaproteobacteria bacterium]
MNDATDLEQKLQDARQLHSGGQLPQAERLYRQILKVAPSHPEALHYLGVIGLQVGRNEDAVTLIGKVLDLQPDNYNAMVNLGNGLQALGRIDEAIKSYQQALALQPKSAAIHSNLGNALMAKGEIGRAIERYEAALVFDPELTETRRNLAGSLLTQGQPDEALHHIMIAANANPDAIEVQLSMGNILQELGRHDDAIACFTAVSEAQPDAAPVHCNLGNVLKDVGRLFDATEHYEKALELDPNYAEAHYCLGRMRQYLGDNEEASSEFRKAISFDRHCTKAWRAITELTRQALTDAEIKTVGTALESEDYSSEQRLHLEFALGKSCEDSGLHATAAEHYRRGNRLCRNRIAYSLEQDQNVFEHVKATFNERFFDQWANAGSTDATPLFVVGMPRSGSTLVEQILASHPSVHGGGELSLLPQAIARRFPLANGIDYTAALATASQADFDFVAESYLATQLKLAPDSERISDKLLINFLNIGLIHVLFPNACIIHCVREARDTCFSIYKRIFGARGHHYAYDLEELGRYYNEYAKLMVHWEDVLPGRVHQVCYESLVQEQEPTTRELLEFCELSWDPACLEFHRSERPVVTHSASQVREPIFRDSIGAWRPYETSLAPLLRLLPAN